MGENKGNGASSSSSSGSGSWDDGKEVLRRIESMNQAQSLGHNLESYQKQFDGSVERLLEYLDSSGSRGIASDSAEKRRELLGCNSLPSKDPNGFWKLFVDSFDDPTVQILMVAAIVSLAVGMYEDPTTGYIEGVAILTAVLVVALVTAVNDYEKEKQFRVLSAANDELDILVYRDGRAMTIPIDDLVVGDIVVVEAGDRIPCDGVLCQCDGLEVDESALTGEPDDVAKSLDSDPFVLSGCTAMAGTGKLMCMAVGANSQWGMIKAHLEKEQDQTPLQEKLDDMAALIGYVGMGAAAATFVAMMILKCYVKPDYLEDISLFSHALDAFIIGVTIVVVAVPEGLPLAVTISLAFSTKKMLKDNNLIRNLTACETMGNATNICSDKTGTLTENRMTVVQAHIHDTPGLTSTTPGETLLQCIATCSTARILHQDKTNPRPSMIGNKTEAALLLWAQTYCNDDYEVRRNKAQFGTHSKLFPFSSQRKRMSVLVQESFSSYMLYHKGAAETVLQLCSHYTAADGSTHVMTEEKREEYHQCIVTYAKDALRCVACASKVVDATTAASITNDPTSLEHGLCWHAMFGIQDPLRKDVVQAVLTCQKAGIFVRMVTGDNLHTAKAIAKQAGILTTEGLSMEGEEFRKLTPAQLDQVLPKLQVLARSSPQDKHILVQRLNGGLMPKNKQDWEEVHPGRDWETERDLLLPGYHQEWAANRVNGVGEVVGVTGDGTNDGPALKAADVGLSMGISGTDVAKKASDIIIMDDNFSSIVRAVLWGRSVFDNIRKFLQFQLTVNVVALTITFLSAVAGYKPPLNAVMMLWVNLIMDTMGALALGTEPPTLELLNRRPYRRDASLINYPMWRNILVQATYQLGMLIFLLQKGPELFDNCQSGSTHHFTILFNAFVFCQIFNEFNAREIGDVFQPFAKLGKSPMFLLIIIVTVISQYLIVVYGGDFTQTSPLSVQEWKVTVALGALSVPIGYLMRQIPIDEDPASFAGIDNTNLTNDNDHKKNN